MKASIIIAILILVVGAIIGWQEETQLSSVREKQRRLIAEATALGIPTETTTDPSTSATRSDRHSQADAAAADEARTFAAELIAFAIKLQAAQQSGRPLDEETEKGIFIQIGRLAKLDADQLRILIDEVKRNPSLDDDIRRGIIGFSISMLANDHPQAALTMATEAADIFGDEDRGNHVISSALAKWAERDPAAALDWLRQNADEHPGINNEEAKRGIIKGAAIQDPRLALSLIDELDIEDISRTARTITDTAQSSEQRSALLHALRAKSESDGAIDQQLLESTLNSLGARMARDGFDSSIQWIQQNELSDEEEAAFAEGLRHHQTRDDTGRWIDWMSDKLPAEKLDDQVLLMVAQWTHDDYEAAGSWLNDATGPTRDPAVRAYAKTVAPYEAETAATWALTLPAGDERSGLLKEIHSQWKSQDEAAAARFAEAHDLAE